MATFYILAGIIAGSLTDPVMLICLSAAVLAAFMSRPWQWLFGFALVAALLRSGISASNRAALGLDASTFPALVALATIIAMLVVFCGALLSKRAMKR